MWRWRPVCFVLWATWFNLLELASALLLIATGLYLRPRAPRLSEPLRGRDDLPKLFALLDQLSAKLGAEKIDAVMVSEDIKAFMAGPKRHGHVLGIGAPLWMGLESDERLAVLSHEVAHLAHRDPARGGSPGRPSTLWGVGSIFFTPPALID